MPAGKRLNELADRKALLVAQSELHRQLLLVERARWRQRGEAAQSFVDQHRTLLLVGATVIGGLVAWRGRRLVEWLPTLIRTVSNFVR